MQNDLNLISHKAIQNIISDVNPIYKIVKEAYLSHENGNTVMPGSYFLRFPNNPKARIIALPGYLSDDFNIAGIKWISSNPDNINNGLPRASALILLNDPNTGRPIACLEGAQISANRTAASAVLAAEHMWHNYKKVDSVGFIGNGPIASEIYRYFIGTDWDIKSINMFDLNKSISETFKNMIDLEHHQNVKIMSCASQILETSDIVVFATTTLEPYLNNAALLKQSHLLLNISLRDLGSDLVLSAQNVVDDIPHVLAANTSPHLTQQACRHTNFINGTLGGLMQEKFTLSKNKPCIFSPMGLGTLDLAVAQYILNQSIKQNTHTLVPNFLGSPT